MNENKFVAVDCFTKDKSLKPFHINAFQGKGKTFKALSIALLAGLFVINFNPAYADSNYDSLNDALVDATTPRNYVVSQEGEILTKNQDVVAEGILTVTGPSLENRSVLDASNYSIFDIANDTNLVLKDLEIKNALSNTNGAVLNITNPNATVEINNVNFTNNKISAQGNTYGAAINNDGGTIKSITGNFTNNAINNHTSGFGAAIANKSGSIGLIKGTFKGNSVSYWESSGGAIYNNANIDSIEGIFESNSATRYGGAIYNDSNGYINNINSNFINNVAHSFSSNYAGGGAITNLGTINKISGLFKGNIASKNNVHTGYVDNAGGAIENSGTINEIYADFIENRIINEAKGASVYGGVIYNRATKIGNIFGNFKNNAAISGNFIGGGVITNWDDSSIESINGNFVQNSSVASSYVYGGGILNYGSIDSIVGNFLNNSATASSRVVGGSIMNDGTIDSVVSKFLNNSTDSGDGINGGVIYNTGTINNLQGEFSNNSSISGSWINGAVISNSGTIGSISGIVSNNYSETGTYNFGSIFFNKGNIKNLNLSFLNNTSTSGSSYVSGTLVNYTGGEIETLQGDFIGNKLTSSKTYTYGGAIYNLGKIGSVTGNFVDNFLDSTMLSTGGAIFNKSNIKDISANFIHNIVNSKNEVSGGALRNNGTIDRISGNFVNNSGIANAKEALGGAIFEVGSTGTISANFIGNSAISKSKNMLALGGAVYSNRMDLNFSANNTTNLFSGNYTEDYRGKINNAIFTRTNKAVDGTFYNPTVTFEATNNGSFVIDDSIDGGEVYGDGFTTDDFSIIERTHQYNLNFKGDETGKIYLNDKIYNANIAQTNVTTYINEASNLNYGNSLSVNSGIMNINHMGMSPLNFNSFANTGTININSVDINPATETMGRLTANNYGSQTGSINVNGLNVLADPVKDTTNVLFADSAFANSVKYNGSSTYMGKIYKYNIGYLPESGEFQFIRSGGSSGAEAFNPSILSTGVTSQAGTNATVNETFKYVFEHADAFTQLPSMDRFAMINENRYALSSDFNNNLPTPNASEFNNKAGWFRPYVSFEKMNLRNAGAVNATTYGSLFGFDSDFQHYKRGWTGITTGYIGYNGSQLRYTGADTTMNGGLVGFTQSFYKGNFWTALTLSAGASVGESNTMYGKEDFTTLFAGLGSKTGYNFEFKEGKYIIQPIWFMSYTFGKTFDYTNAAGVRIDSSPMHSIMLNPSVRFIANSKNGWQPYFSVGMVWNAMSESDVKANGVKLPEASIKPYVEYGLGVQKRFKDHFVAFCQAMIRNGGRNGISMTAGFRWAIGKNNSSHNQEKVSLPQSKISSYKQNVEQHSTRKIIKQLSTEQRIQLSQKYQNTTKTTSNGVLKQL